MLGQKSCRKKVSRIFRICVPISLRIFPEFFEDFSCFVSWETEIRKKSPKNPRHFSMQNSQANTKKIFTKFFWRGRQRNNMTEHLMIRKATDAFKCLRHVMRALLSVRPRCSHIRVSLKESPLKPVLILQHVTSKATEQTSMRTKWLNISRFKLFRSIAYHPHRNNYKRK